MDEARSSHRKLTVPVAAARLGVKRETLYAYVSRGLLHREVAADGRSSLFDAAEIDELAARRSGRSKREVRAAVSTELSHVADDGLWIRGRDLIELASQNTAYEEVADLLWEAPTSEEWIRVSGVGLGEAIDVLPVGAPLVDRLRVAAALASANDPLRHNRSPKAVRAMGRSLVGQLVQALPVEAPEVGSRLADQLWSRLAARKGRRAERDSLNMAMVLLIDHGLAPSTFAARLAASVRADPYSVVVAGLGVVGGPMHGASSAHVHRMFEAAAGPGGAEAAVGAALERFDTPPGFGHAVYKLQDPRYGALMAQLMTAWRRDRRLAVVQQVRDVISARTEDLPNVDLALGALTYLSGMEADAGEAIFAIARTAGWLGHALEEYEEQPLRFRPRARYVGPDA